MTTRKILHAADIHLDSPLQRLDAYENAPVDQIRGASRRALAAMTDLAIDQEVDLVVIAGDLYDGDWPDQNTGLFFVSQATRLIQAGIPLAVIRGNHDAANKMTSSLPLPKNPDGSDVMLDDRKVDQRIFESTGIVVHGRSYSKRAETSNLAEKYPDALGGLFNLGLLHTSLTGAQGHENYAPCTPQQLADKHYDYWALGHIHIRGEHQVDGAAPVVFSGNVQGRHIRESGEKGCLLIDIDARNQTTRSFHSLDVVRWEVCSIDVSAMQNSDEIIDAFQAWIPKALDSADDRLLVVRVILTGASTLHTTLHQKRESLESDLRSVAVQTGREQLWIEKLRVSTSLPVSRDDSMQWDGPMESISHVIERYRSNPELGALMESWLAPLAKKMPPELSRDNQVIATDDPVWNEALLESAAAELTGRLLGSGEKR